MIKPGTILEVSSYPGITLLDKDAKYSARVKKSTRCPCGSILTVVDIKRERSILAFIVLFNGVCYRTCYDYSFNDKDMFEHHFKVLIEPK